MVNMAEFSFKTCRKCSLILFFMLLLQLGHAQTDFSTLHAILKKNEKLLGKEHVVVVQKDGKNIFLKETDELKLKTPVPIASASKWFTAAMIMVLVDEGKLNLDDPVAKYIPIFEKYMKGYITIRHCLSHTTGLDSDPISLMKLIQRTKFESLEKEVESFATKKLIVDNPGQAFAYGGVGINIAGRVIEIVTKKKFDRVIVEKLFRPLGMKTASFYNENGNATNPSGGASCSASDYLNFMQMILNKGMFNGKKILSEKSVQEILTAQYPDAKIRYSPVSAKGAGYGLGNWVLENHETGKGQIFASPGLFGTWPWVDIKNKYSAIIMIKSLNGNEKRDLYQEVKDAIEASIQ
jgi:CubicO group peptidase (beta-lactamase class C family)